MSRKLAALSVALAAAVLAACGGNYGNNTAGNNVTGALPNMPGSDLYRPTPRW